MIHKMATKYGLKIKYMSRHQLSDFPGIGKDRPHQNVIMKVSRLAYEEIRVFGDIEKPK